MTHHRGLRSRSARPSEHKPSPLRFLLVALTEIRSIVTPNTLPAWHLRQRGIEPASERQRRTTWNAFLRTSLTRIVAASLVCLLAAACTETPTQPRDTTLPTGRWTGDGACLSVAVDGCDLVVGCGHGQFAQPDVHADGTFAVSGTYRIEVGPISINPAPTATFSGVLNGQTLTLSVAPSDPSLRPASYVLQLTNTTGKCSVPCV